MAEATVTIKLADAEPVASIIRAAGTVAVAWRQLCRCVDEFEPEYPTACAERRDALDTAVNDLATLMERLAGGKD